MYNISECEAHFCESNMPHTGLKLHLYPGISHHCLRPKHCEFSVLMCMSQEWLQGRHSHTQFKYYNSVFNTQLAGFNNKPISKLRQVLLVNSDC